MWAFAMGNERKCPKNHYIHDPFEKSDLEICRKRRLVQFDADIVCTVSMLMFCGSRLDKVVLRSRFKSSPKEPTRSHMCLTEVLWMVGLGGCCSPLCK